MVTPSRRAGRLILLSAVVLLVLVAIAFLLGPLLIRAAYEERSFPVLNRALSGRTVHAVDFYLTVWNRLLFQLLLGGGGLLGALALTLRYGRSLGPPLRKALIGQDGTILDLLLTALGFGLLTGMVEALSVIVMAYGGELPNWRFGYSSHVLWMSPLGHCVTFLLIGAVVACVSKLWSPAKGRRAVVLLFCLIGIFVVVRSLRIGIADWAAAILAFGVSWRLAVFADERPVATRRALSWASGVVAVIAVTAAVVRPFDRLSAPPRAPLATEGQARQPYSVLLLILDTARAANFAVYGYERPTTPNFTRRAAETIVFQNAISTSSWTLPSHASLFTGRLPSELGIDWYTRLGEEHPTLSEALAGAGYATGGFVGNTFFVSRRSGLARGFEAFRDFPINWRMVVANTWLARRIVARLQGQPDVVEPWGDFNRKSAAQINGEFLDWVDTVDDRPFFGFINYVNTHHPYHAPEPYDTSFANPAPRIRLDLQDRYSREELVDFVDAYDGAVAYLDAQIENLFQELQARGLLESTIVIISSDHGEQFGEKQIEAVGHGNTLYYPAVHVPLLLRMPDLEGGGSRIPYTVSIRDIPATILDLVGLPAGPIPGTSLAGAWRDGIQPGSPTVTEIGLTGAFGDQVTPSEGFTRSYIDGSLTYVRNLDGSEELFDRSRDRWERVPLQDSAAYRGDLERLRGLLDRSVPNSSRP